MKIVGKLIFLVSIIGLFSCRTEVHQLESSCGIPMTSCKENFAVYSGQNINSEIYKSAEKEILKLMTLEMYNETIELDEFQFLDSCEHTREYEWTVPQYSFVFNWKQPKGSIVSNYCFNVTLDSEGKLIDEIRIGNSKLKSENKQLISLLDFKDIWTKAQTEGMDSYHLDFDTKRRIVTIELGKYLNHGASDVISSKTLKVINAYNGKEIK